MRKSPEKIDRRGFLLLSGTAPAAGSLALTARPPNAHEEASDNAPARESRGATEHIRRFYRLARF